MFAYEEPSASPPSDMLAALQKGVRQPADMTAIDNSGFTFLCRVLWFIDLSLYPQEAERIATRCKTDARLRAVIDAHRRRG